MSQLTVTVLQLGLLVLLWLFVLGVVGVLRRDLFGTRVVPRTSAPGTAPGAPAPVAPPTAPPAAPVAPVAPVAPPAAARPAPGPAAATVPVRSPEPPAAPPQPVGPRSLVVTEGPLAGTSLPLGPSAVLIGRAPECTLVLPDDYASSRHARLVPESGRWFLEDLGSTNGTTLGRGGEGAPVTRRTEVGVGSAIRIGRTTLELRR